MPKVQAHQPIPFLKSAVGSWQLAILYFFAYCPLLIVD